MTAAVPARAGPSAGAPVRHAQSLPGRGIYTGSSWVRAVRRWKAEIASSPRLGPPRAYSPTADQAGFCAVGVAKRLLQEGGPFFFFSVIFGGVLPPFASSQRWRSFEQGAPQPAPFPGPSSAGFLARPSCPGW